MYLSRIEIDTHNRQKMKDLTVLSAYHNWVEQSFPDERKASSRHLWRVDHLNGKDYLLILSKVQPDHQKMAMYGVPGTAITKDYNQLLNDIHDGQQLRFRVTANPTYSVSLDPHVRGKLYPYVTIDQQKHWLLSKMDTNGFEILRKAPGLDPDNVNSWAFDTVKRSHPFLSHKKNRHVHISSVSFEGLLTVKNANLFKQLLVNGLGREKAFGMGLMTVIPLSN